MINEMSLNEMSLLECLDFFFFLILSFIVGQHRTGDVFPILLS